MKLDIVNKMTRAFHEVGFQIKKHSPEILVVTGVVGTVASAVIACKATTKLSTVLEKSKNNIDTIHAYVEDNGYSDEYTEADCKKDLTIEYTKAGVELVKLYAPAVALGALSIAAILTSNNIMRKRNVALAAAYATVDRGFKNYRGRVIERFGEELDRELKYDIKAKEVEEVVVNEDGTETTVKKTINVTELAPNDYSPYSIVFDDGNPGWDKDPELTKWHLIQVQNWANERLKNTKRVFLNEVYEMLGAQKTKAGQRVGWIYNPDHPNGDNYIDFGIFDIHRPKARDFVNGYERVVVLDFNVDGDIYDTLV